MLAMWATGFLDGFIPGVIFSIYFERGRVSVGGVIASILAGLFTFLPQLLLGANA